MLNSLKKRYERERPYCQQLGIDPPYTRVTVIDCKGSYWGGYDTVVDLDGNSCVVEVDESDLNTVLKAYNKIAFFAGEVLPKRRRERVHRHRQGQPYVPRPHVLLIEEWLYLLELADEYDFEQGLKGNASIKQRLIRKVKAIVRTGLEDAVQLWLSSQEPTVQENCFSAAFRYNFDYYCFGSPARGYNSIEVAIDPRYRIVPSSETRKELAKRLAYLKSMGIWTTFAISGDPAKQEANGPRLGRTPMIDPAIKRQQFVFGPLKQDTDWEADWGTESPQKGVKQGVERSAVEPDDLHSVVAEPSGIAQVIAFPKRLSRGAERLIEYTREQGGTLPRLQQAYSRLGTRWNTAEIVKGLAVECVEAGLARLVENTNYAGSYRFELTEPTENMN
jgi:hypothetical protein